MSSFFAQSITIQGKEIGPASPVYIIAEAGVAHFGSLEKAMNLVALAAAAKADAVKFQIFDVDRLINSQDAGWKERLRSRQLPWQDFLTIKAYCQEKGITFLCTAHDEVAFVYLADTLDVSAFKIGSGEVKNLPFIEKIAAKGKPVLVSTGMYTMEDIAAVVSIFQRCGNRNLIFLHCITSYPVPYGQVNLSFMNTLREFGALVGYSDHTKGFHISLAAAALGARVIEKHITLDYHVPNAQDWKVSCGSSNLRCFVREVRQIEAALGCSGAKTPAPCEEASIAWARKSIVAACPIQTGARITRDMIDFKRPGDGIAPDALDTVIGRIAKTDISADTTLRYEDLHDQT